LGCAGGSVFVAALLLAASLLTIGIDDGERRNISRTGSVSRPSAIRWESWRANEGFIRPFPGFGREKPQAIFLEARGGIASGWLFDFTVYELRSIPGDVNSIVPAIGPGWGAHYHSWLAVVALIVAATFMVLAFQQRGGWTKETGCVL
jgi:hypothetical protein